MVNPNKTLYTTGYTVGQVPANITSNADIIAYFQNELIKISAFMNLLKTNAMDPTYDPPLRPRQGMAVYALGAPYWDPGSGEAWYFYNSAGAWQLLG